MAFLYELKVYSFYFSMSLSHNVRGWKYLGGLHDFNLWPAVALKWTLNACLDITLPIIFNVIPNTPGSVVYSTHDHKFIISSSGPKICFNIQVDLQHLKMPLYRSRSQKETHYRLKKKRKSKKSKAELFECINFLLIITFLIKIVIKL